MPNQILRVLIVDDDPNVARALERALCEHRPVVEVDPLAAMQRLTAGQWFDVVVSDKHMPGMDGVELLAIARKLQDPPIFVIMSGDEDAEAIDADATLVKPFSARQLLALITGIASRRAVAVTQPLPHARLSSV